MEHCVDHSEAPSFILSGTGNMGLPHHHSTAYPVLLFSWVCGCPGTFTTWGTMWDSQVEHKVLRSGRGEAALPEESLVTLRPHPSSDCSSISGRCFFLLVSHRDVLYPTF